MKDMKIQGKNNNGFSKTIAELVVERLVSLGEKQRGCMFLLTHEVEIPNDILINSCIDQCNTK